MAEAEKPLPLKDGSAGVAQASQRYVDRYFRKPNEERLLAGAGQDNRDAG